MAVTITFIVTFIILSTILIGIYGGGDDE